MVAQLVEPERAYYSVLRWRPDPARDEPKNIGVLVSGIEGDFFELRSVNLGRVSTKIAEQGLLDRMVEGFAGAVHGDASHAGASCASCGRNCGARL